jgi:hypothetical protein
VKGGAFSAFRGLNTVSMAKKHPATAALNPENQHIQSALLAKAASKG